MTDRSTPPLGPKMWACGWRSRGSFAKNALQVCPRLGTVLSGVAAGESTGLFTILAVLARACRPLKPPSCCSGLLLVNSGSPYNDIVSLALRKKVLRTRGVRNLVLTGVTTDVCVHTTMRNANDMGYECVLLEVRSRRVKAAEGSPKPARKTKRIVR